MGVIAEYPDKTRFARRMEDRMVYQFLLDHGPALASEIGQAFPNQTQHVRSGVMKRLRSAGLVDYQMVVVKGVTTRRWRAI